MRRLLLLLPLAAALALVACHRNTAEVTLDTDADLRNATEAKIDADLAAADTAARAPMPRVAPPPAAPADKQPEARRAEAAPTDASDNSDR